MAPLKEKLKALMGRLSTALAGLTVLPADRSIEKDYAWLREGRELAEGRKKADRSAALSSAAAFAAFIAIFAASFFTSRGPSLDELLVRPEEGSRRIVLEAELSSGSRTERESLSIDVLPEGYVAPEREDAPEDPDASAIRSALYRLQDMLSRDSSGGKLTLPRMLDGVRIDWTLPESAPAWALLAGALPLSALLWIFRYGAMRRELEREKRETEDAIPAMVMELSLLMDAGLVLGSAFEQLIERRPGSDQPLDRLLRRCLNESRMGNEPFVSVLYRYAAESGIRDLVRFAGMMAEQQDRGSELSAKLERERARLWSARLSSARGRSKTAETRLSFPLMLVLLSLVLIAAGPAMLDM
ncbi:MAG: type II secretion system F family protein [Firmicutes bacterium]|nr:type II secretion system F family protein [Bacillota bacterium]